MMIGRCSGFWMLLSTAETPEPATDRRTKRVVKKAATSRLDGELYTIKSIVTL